MGDEDVAGGSACESYTGEDDVIARNTDVLPRSPGPQMWGRFPGRKERSRHGVGRMDGKLTVDDPALYSVAVTYQIPRSSGPPLESAQRSVEGGEAEDVRLPRFGKDDDKAFQESAHLTVNLRLPRRRRGRPAIVRAGGVWGRVVDQETELAIDDPALDSGRGHVPVCINTARRAGCPFRNIWKGAKSGHACGAAGTTSNSKSGSEPKIFGSDGAVTIAPSTTGCIGCNAEGWQRWRWQVDA
ncbi:hypothetical protein EDB86DRAFT_3196955 [Lactarius hatsudake]|nr:hypothetical protein EDB86DRAFT_3196955 [Lactarius hatsudake]